MQGKHIHLVGKAASDLEVIIAEFIDSYDNISFYESEIELAKRLLKFMESEKIDYYDA